MTTTNLHPLGQPEIEVTRIEDGRELVFTAEVDVRPDIDLPDLSRLNFSVESIEVSDEEVETELTALRARFGTLKAWTVQLKWVISSRSISRPPLTARRFPTAKLRDVPRGRLGPAHRGARRCDRRAVAGESATFTTKLVAGDHAGEDAEITVTVQSIKERNCPSLTTTSPSWPKRIRHHCRPGNNLISQVERGQADSPGREDPRQRTGDAARAHRGASSRDDCAVPGGRRVAQRNPRFRP